MMIKWNRHTIQQARRFPGGGGGPEPPNICIGGVQRVKNPPIKINMFAIYHGYQQNKISVLTDFSCLKSWKLHVTALSLDFIAIITIRICLSRSQYIAQVLFVYVTNSLLCLCVCQWSLDEESPHCYNRALRREDILRLAASEHISVVTQYCNGAIRAGS